ncbi:putative nuclease HARBI1 isoform X3 [Harpegnathos saltator]|uniref:putative nuclease HARBI1 isoform X3 n=1 Tax=Harpegnathos saltator TaxID=610380 RepID=UPI000DBED3F9|nr:putative nuclease HARBI1 isoform X3 [Harpegnathos saltator]
MALEYLVWELGLVVERVRRLERRVARRRLRDAQNPFHIPRDEFIDYFRLTPELVLIAIQFYAQGSYQRSVGNQFQWIVSQSTTSRCLHAVTEAIYRRLLRRWVNFPMNEEDRQQARAKFSAATYPFEDAIAAIDCTFIHIIAPHENEEAFINHHGRHSLNVQAIVDPDMKLLNINPRYPDARNDSYIWSTSPIRRAMEFHYNRGERKTWLIVYCKIQTKEDSTSLFRGKPREKDRS